MMTIISGGERTEVTKDEASDRIMEYLSMGGHQVWDYIRVTNDFPLEFQIKSPSGFKAVMTQTQTGMEIRLC